MGKFDSYFGQRMHFLCYLFFLLPFHAFVCDKGWAIRANFVDIPWTLVAIYLIIKFSWVKMSYIGVI